MKKNILLFLLALSFSTLSFAASNSIREEQGEDIDGVMCYKTSHTPYTGKIISQKDRSYYKNGKPHGKWLSFYPNGNLRSIENWKEGKLVGKFVLYESDGTKVFETTYLNGKDNGDYYMYHENGVIQVKGKFSNGVPKGTWKFYNASGKLTGKAEY